MNLYLVRRPDTTSPQHDATFGFVVRAARASDARRLAAEQCGDEGPAVWTDQRTSTCAEIGIAPEGSEPSVVLRDFNAG